jgi:hypothetical protein
MDSKRLAKRVESLREKLKGNNAGDYIRIDFDSFSKEEKLLFARADEIEEELRQTGASEHPAEDWDVIFKSMEVVLRRVKELYCYFYPIVFGLDGTKEIVEYFFKLHFYNFEFDLSECLSHVRSTWSEKDKEEFLLDLKQNGPPFFRLPRGLSNLNDKRVGDLNHSKDLDKQEEKEEK